MKHFELYHIILRLGMNCLLHEYGCCQSDIKDYLDKQKYKGLRNLVAINKWLDEKGVKQLSHRDQENLNDFYKNWKKKRDYDSNFRFDCGGRKVI